MTPDRLREVCTMLYGDRWQTQLARDLDINSRRVRYWTKHGAPDWMEGRIKEIVRQKFNILKGELK
jgi:hypothetical protein